MIALDIFLPLQHECSSKQEFRTHPLLVCLPAKQVCKNLHQHRIPGWWDPDSHLHSHKKNPWFSAWEDHGKIMGRSWEWGPISQSVPINFMEMVSIDLFCTWFTHGASVWVVPSVLVCELQVRPRGMKLQGTSPKHWSIWLWYGALNWLKGQITGNHGFYLQIQVFPISHQPFPGMVLVNSKHGW